jgi:hypothetical protein
LLAQLEDLRKNLKQIIRPVPSSAFGVRVSKTSEEWFVDGGRGHVMDIGQVLQNAEVVLPRPGASSPGALRVGADYLAQRAWKAFAPALLLARRFDLREFSKKLWSSELGS